LGLRLNRGIATGEQSSLLTHIGMMESVSLCARMRKLTAFLELESPIREQPK
jgi:hypothetical protein